jgi:hypothetical protein
MAKPVSAALDAGYRRLHGVIPYNLARSTLDPGSLNSPNPARLLNLSTTWRNELLPPAQAKRAGIGASLGFMELHQAG